MKFNRAAKMILTIIGMQLILCLPININITMDLEELDDYPIVIKCKDLTAP